jgi:hypothetical protein
MNWYTLPRDKKSIVSAAVRLYPRGGRDGKREVRVRRGGDKR